MRRRERNEKKTQTPGLSLQNVLSLNAVKCTGAKLISSIILPDTLGYSSDEFGFGGFRCSILEKVLIESLKIFGDWSLLLFTKERPDINIKMPAFNVMGNIIIES